MKTKNHKILENELKRTFPIYIFGMLFHAVEIYIVYKIPMIIGSILDLLIKQSSTQQAIMNQVYLLIFYSAIMIVPRIIYRTLYFTTARTSDIILRKKVIEHLQNVKPEYFDKEEKGAFLAYLCKELLKIRKFLGNAFFYVTKLAIAPIIGFILIGRDFNGILAWSLVPIFPIAIVALWKLYKKQEKVIENERKAYVELSHTIEQNTSGFHLIKLYNEQENQQKKFDEINKKIYKTNYDDGDVINQTELVSDSLYALCYTLGFGMGLILIDKNLLTVGELTAYMSCITIVISEIVNSVQPLMNGMVYFKQAIRRFNYFFCLESYPKEGKKLKDIDKVEINHLSYRYGKNEKLALDNVTMTIQKGEKIGIVGKVGSGKTTLMNIIAGLYEVPNGNVLINGRDINEYARDAIFENIGYATQKSIILDDTIKNNIDITENAQTKELEEITKKADIDKDIQLMQDGLETKIGENGVKVSGGQKQRIQIARNLLNVRKINIFDDSLSALDGSTEKRVLEEIQKEVGNNILIVISNKVSMMEKMDRIYGLVDGKIIAEGTHEELLENQAFYRELSELEKVGDFL